MVQLSDLLNAEVQTPDGRRLGRVGDVRVTRNETGTWQVSHLLIGSGSMLERLGLRRDAAKAIAWTDVQDIGHGAIIVNGPTPAAIDA